MDDVYMREKRKWDGYSYRKTIPSLQAYPQKITSKMEEAFFFFLVMGFLKRGERKIFRNF